MSKLKKITTNDEFVSELKTINRLLNEDRARFTKGIDPTLQKLIDQAINGEEELSALQKASLALGLGTWAEKRTRNNKIIRGVLHTVAAVLTGGLFHVGYAVWRWVRNTFNFNIDNDFGSLKGSDLRHDFTKETFRSSIGKAFSDLKAVRKFLTQSYGFLKASSNDNVTEESESDSYSEITEDFGGKKENVGKKDADESSEMSFHESSAEIDRNTNVANTFFETTGKKLCVTKDKAGQYRAGTVEVISSDEEEESSSESSLSN